LKTLVDVGPASRRAARAIALSLVRLGVGFRRVYDLVADPGETRDVAARNPEVAARLARLLDEAHTPSALWKAPAEQ